METRKPRVKHERVTGTGQPFASHVNRCKLVRSLLTVCLQQLSTVSQSKQRLSCFVYGVEVWTRRCAHLLSCQQFIYALTPLHVLLPTVYVVMGLPFRSNHNTVHSAAATYGTQSSGMHTLQTYRNVGEHGAPPDGTAGGYDDPQIPRFKLCTRVVCRHRV